MLAGYILLFFITLSTANRSGYGCLPYRERYKLHNPCEEEPDREAEIEEQFDREVWLKGEPSAFARTGFYDRLFRQQNTIAYQGQYSYYPNYGYNANLPEDKPFGPYFYRYSNFFTNKKK